MINTSNMEWVITTWVPHASHQMGRAESELVFAASNDRFGTVRRCMWCLGSEVRAGGAHYADPKLMGPCQ
jgi:hypothetical protein